ncbi:MAG: type II toxin-antitoxin system RelE/ParE family toxin [Terrimicrobiaceae bacterium]
MQIPFIESHKFAEQVTWLNAEEAVWELETELLQNPDKGDLIQGTGGFRKIRMKLPGRGKSAGARVVYFHLRDRAVIFLFLLYTKSGQSDLSAEQRAALRQQAHYLK